LSDRAAAPAVRTGRGAARGRRAMNAPQPGIRAVPRGRYPLPPHRMLVGTFHKSGTILMWTVFQKYARHLRYRMWVQNSRPAPPAWDICFDAHSYFRYGVLDLPHRGVVVIRDPRDVIISGALYHARLQPGGGDRWALVPDARFGGLSYQQKIAGLEDDAQRFLFEMDHFGKRTLKQMALYARVPQNFIIVRFEDLVTDETLGEFARMFDWLGAPPEEHAALLRIAHDASLFSGKVATPHVRSGRPAQWRTLFTPALHEAFRARFGDIAESLGYPPA
jgi:hypothetical protein